jgi:hypothetical protein
VGQKHAGIPPFSVNVRRLPVKPLSGTKRPFTTGDTERQSRKLSAISFQLLESRGTINQLAKAA